MAKKALEELVEIALEMNLESRKAVLDRLGISERTWSKWIKDSEIYFDKSVKAYIVPGIDITSKKDNTIDNNNVTDLNSYRNSESKEEDTEFLDVTELIKKIATGEEVTADNSDIKDLPIYSPESENVENKESAEAETESEDLKENTDAIESKNATSEHLESDSKENEEAKEKPTLELVKEKFMVTKDIMNALRCKALTESVEVDVLVRDLLLQSIENKYFMDIEKGL